VLDHVIGHHHIEGLVRKRELHSGNPLESVPFGHDPLIHNIDRVDDVIVCRMTAEESSDAACPRTDFKEMQLGAGRQSCTF
jgi:hypothetical protein